MNELGEELLKQGGLWGLIVLGLLVALRTLWVDNKQLRAQLDTEKELRLAEKEKRVTEAKETTGALLATTERTREAVSKLHELAERFTQPKS